MIYLIVYLLGIAAINAKYIHCQGWYNAYRFYNKEEALLFPVLCFGWPIILPMLAYVEWSERRADRKQKILENIIRLKDQEWYEDV